MTENDVAGQHRAFRIMSSGVQLSPAAGKLRLATGRRERSDPAGLDELGLRLIKDPHQQACRCNGFAGF